MPQNPKNILSKILIVIPSRLESTRLAEKALADIAGKPMIRWVFERAEMAARTLKESFPGMVCDVIVATDHEKIKNLVESFGGKVVMTSSQIQSGTDRVAKVAETYPDYDVFVNLQGDEPLMDPECVTAAVKLILLGEFSITTTAVPFDSFGDFDNPNAVKVMKGAQDQAIYFSRFPFPYSRESRPKNPKDLICQQHLGIYVYTKAALLKFAQSARTKLEISESLEQLRALHYGMPIGVALSQNKSIGVDTLEDLEMVRKLVKTGV